MRKVSSALACALAGLGCLSAQLCAAQTPRRIPRQQSGHQAAVAGRLTTGTSADGNTPQAVVGAEIALQSGNHVVSAVTDADGVFRVGGLPAGSYLLSAKHAGFQPFMRAHVQLREGEMLVLEISMTPAEGGIAVTPGVARQIPPPTPEGEGTPQPSYREISRRPTTDSLAVSFAEVPPPDKNFVTETDRWDLQMPKWDRYDRQGEFGWTMGRWWDPFNR